MSNKNNLTVEIFSDLHTPGIAVDPVITSLAGIAKLTNSEFDILKTTRRLKIAGEDARKVTTSRVKWNILPADINIVLSGRPIVSEDSSRQICGQTFVEHGKGLGHRGVIVSTYENDELVSTASHEIFHTLNLKNSGDMWDGHAHCLDDQCIMHKSINRIDSTEEKVPSSFTDRIHKLFRGSLVETKSAVKNQTPCVECIGQVGRSAFLLTEAKNGRHIPSNLIFPHFAKRI